MKSRRDSLVVRGRAVVLEKSYNPPFKRLVTTLQKAPYQDPSIARERDEIIEKLNARDQRLGLTLISLRKLIRVRICTPLCSV